MDGSLITKGVKNGGCFNNSSGIFLLAVGVHHPPVKIDSDLLETAISRWKLYFI